MVVSRRAAPKLGSCNYFFGGQGGLAFYDLEESNIFLRLTAELAGKYALIVIFACLGVGMWGILGGVYILAVKEWVFHLGPAFRRSCFVFIVSNIFVAVCVSFFSYFSFLYMFLSPPCSRTFRPRFLGTTLS